jgi:glycosyltransferase involved in cell wall biosynthesis
MRVLMLKEALPTGGAERQLALIVKHLPDEWERRVWAMGGGPFADVIAGGGHQVDVCPRSARFDVRPAASLWRLIRSWRPDVVHSWDWMSSLAAYPLCRALGIPIIDGTIRNGIARRRRSTLLRLSRLGASLIVANSRAGLDAWGVGPTKGRVVYNGFDPERLSLCEPATERAPSSSAGCTAVMTGRMIAHKDFSTLIAAARQLDGEAPGRWRFLLLGDGPDKPALEALAGDLVARHVVRFVSPGLEVLPWLRDADVGVLMSAEDVHREGCSNAIMEYMASGLPVVCSSGGGNPELVVDGVTGRLVAAGDAQALVDRLAGLAGDAEARTRMGAAGRSRLVSEFSAERMIARLVRIYHEVLTG